MIYRFDLSLIKNYHSNSQKIRVLTEDWVLRNFNCPICGKSKIEAYPNNYPAGDFFCKNCKSDFELKSKESSSGKLPNIITDGAYTTMIERITSSKNPNFLFLTYKEYEVSNFILIPNHFFTPSIILKRRPLSNKARRAGWVGCNIDISRIPDSGKIFIIKNQIETDSKEIITKYAKIKTLKKKNIESRGWLLDTITCIEKINSPEFSLSQIYAFEEELKLKHPENNFIKDKLRQQLQYLRDKGFIQFLGRGNYKKL
ncbi:restriction endonuclease [Treponema sp. OMZ 788]|uniref:DpnI domain-containing protein n=1 Tax=Treponema sp. OMZ 788 TaxID=2563664 RepID=UPI0020A4915E|nr:DpnI domain-containing protein [Treponema sp. OMZ 788]UTC63758.1 restriction endonuclease [Treponema sp. OMZ 788]